MDAISVAVTRGGVVEARHRVHAVAVRDGATVERAGDAGLVTFLRSAAKPLQAAPLAEDYPELGDAALVVASSSHLAGEEQLAAVRELLALSGSGEDDLACGPEDGSRLRHNCSGKHAGFLAVCAARGWERAGYHRADHPLQQELLARIEAAAGERAETAVDGCGVVTFAFPLAAIARSFQAVPDRIAAAMRARPELIRGPRAADAVLMRDAPGWIAKGGAEGLLCARGPDGVGVALKVEDGAFRAVAPALHAFLARLGQDVPALAEIPVLNSRGETVGAIVTES